MRKRLLFILMCASLQWANGQDVKPKPRYTNHTEVGGLFGRVQYNSFGAEESDTKQSLTVQTYNGFLLSDRFSVGVTVGMDWYKSALINPISAALRFDLTKGRSARLFSTMDAGYGFTWFHDDIEGYNTKGGFMVNPGIGMRYGKPGGANFTMVFSYKRQVAKADEPLLWNQVERYEDRVYNRLAIRLGMSF